VDSPDPPGFHAGRRHGDHPAAGYSRHRKRRPDEYTQPGIR
jgi:hypothetical protein